MPVDRLTVAALLPAGNAEWLPVESGESEATVVYDPVRSCYAKILPSRQADELAAERDRIIWLGSAGIPAPSVLDWRVTDAGACLLTRAVPGVPADQLQATTLRRAWPAVTDVVRQLHKIPAEGCPFDWGLARMMPAARTTVAEGRVRVEFLPVELQRVPPAVILAELEAELPERLVQERTEQVVCHGDLCLPNILVDPDTCQVTGLIDLGRLGRADPYADIAVLLANARETWTDEQEASRAGHEFAQRYGIDLDPGRQWFYLRLDPLTW